MTYSKEKAVSDKDTVNSESRRLAVWYYSAVCIGSALLVIVLIAI